MTTVQFDVQALGMKQAHAAFTAEKILIGRYGTLSALHRALIEIGEHEYVGEDGSGRKFDVIMLPFDPD